MLRGFRFKKIINNDLLHSELLVVDDIVSRG